MRWFIFCKEELLLRVLRDGSYEIPLGDSSPIERKMWMHEFVLEAYSDARAFAVDTPVIADGFRMLPLRSTYYHLPQNDYLLAGKFRELLYWDRDVKHNTVVSVALRCIFIQRFPNDAVSVEKKSGRRCQPPLLSALRGVMKSLWFAPATFVETSTV